MVHHDVGWHTGTHARDYMAIAAIFGFPIALSGSVDPDKIRLGAGSCLRSAVKEYRVDRQAILLWKFGSNDDVHIVANIHRHVLTGRVVVEVQRPKIRSGKGIHYGNCAGAHA